MTDLGPVESQPRVPPEVSVEVIDDRQRLPALVPSWEVLWQESGPDSVFLSQDWLLPWWDRHGAGKALNIVLVREGRELIGLAPWCVETKWGSRSLRTIGHGFIDYEGVLAVREREVEVAAALREWLGASCDYDEAVFERLPVEGLLWRLMAEGRCPERTSAYWETDTSTTASYVDFSRGWMQFEGCLTRKLRADTDRRIRRLSEQGSLALRVVRTHEELGAAFDTFLGWKQIRHKQRYQREDLVHGEGGFWGEAGVAAYYREVAARLLANDRLAFSCLDVNGKMVSAIFGMEKEGVYFHFATTFSLDYAAYSVGRMHIWMLIQELSTRGFHRFDFLVGHEQYKKDLAAQSRPLMQVCMRRLDKGAWVRGLAPWAVGVLERQSWFQRSYRWMKERVAS